MNSVSPSTGARAAVPRLEDAASGQQARIPPVEHRVRVALSPAAAFDLFTRQIARWWPFVGHSCFDAEALDVEFEPRVGGAVAEIARDGRRVTWGWLTEWQAPQGFEMRWHPGQDAEQSTVLAVRFSAIDGGTEVSIRHSGWQARGEHAASRREQYDGGWPLMLAAFTACASQETAS